MNRFLKSERGRRFLYEEYIRKGRSSLAIGEELGINHYYVLQALHYHEIPVRTSAEAAKLARETGSYIREYRELTEEEKKNLAHCARQRWSNLSQEEKDEKVRKLKEGYERYAQSVKGRRIGIDERLKQRDGGSASGTPDVSGGNGEQ